PELDLHEPVTATGGQPATGAAPGRRAVEIVVGAVVTLFVGNIQLAVAAERPQAAIRRALIVAAEIERPVVALLAGRDHPVSAGGGALAERAVESAQGQLVGR